MIRTLVLRCALVAVVSAGAILACTGPAPASAIVTRFTFSTTETFADAPPECMPVVKSGVTTATTIGAGQVTQTANGFAVHLKGVFSYRTDFSDGSYLIGSATGPETFIGTNSRLVHNDVVHESRTIYAADGTPTGTVMIHFLNHITVDAVTGEASASIERFFFTCS